MTHRKLRNCNVTILGDSYSTFQGYIPGGRECYYPSPERVADVLAVEDTWWHQLLNWRDMKLLYNDSWSGSTVCKDVRDGQPPESAFVYRMQETLTASGINDEKPDVIFIFGATNDSWLEKKIGTVQYQDWTDEDLHQVLPAYCHLLEYVTGQNPQATVVCILNTGLKPQIAQGMQEACSHYGTVSVVLTEISKQNGHPSRLGMQQIAQQVDAVLSEL